ncbi:MAG: hypothetical protein DI626_04385 [Micavibrio aeruginosavorus]|uniref:Uncharacterized protein n=1 Tax=Micavibrio aeruginosavorus TaxID=349221 RepID=A0A2W5BZV5_9BACT|nr:MAG: hypothetical protein DI626_04385 [Micavibrio aeruginosavorus]
MSQGKIETDIDLEAEFRELLEYQKNLIARQNEGPLGKAAFLAQCSAEEISDNAVHNTLQMASWAQIQILRLR